MATFSPDEMIWATAIRQKEAPGYMEPEGRYPHHARLILWSRVEITTLSTHGLNFKPVKSARRSESVVGTGETVTAFLDWMTGTLSWIRLGLTYLPTNSTVTLNPALIWSPKLRMSCSDVKYLKFCLVF